MKIILLRIPIVLYSFLVYFMSSLELDRIPKFTILGFDKLIHLTEYFVYVVFMLIALETFEKIKTKRQMIFIAILISMLFGISDEIHQYFVQGRSCSIFDFIADSLGIIIGVILFPKIQIIFKFVHDNFIKTNNK